MSAKRTNTLQRGVDTTNGTGTFDPTETPMIGGKGQAESSRDTTPPTNVVTSASEDLEIVIRRTAYEIFLSRGGRDGDDLADWLEAERVVRRGRESEIS